MMTTTTNERKYLRYKKNGPIHILETNSNNRALCGTLDELGFGKVITAEEIRDNDFTCKICLRKVMAMDKERKSHIMFTGDYLKNEQQELCRINTWKDQIDYKIIICAECNKTACECKIG